MVQVMQMFKEATLSRSVGVDWSTSAKGAVPTKKKKRRKKDRDAMDQATTAKTPLILFDDSDLLHDEDRGTCIPIYLYSPPLTAQQALMILVNAQ